MNFSVAKAGPTVPTGVNPKFFNSVKVQPMGNQKFKTGNVIKMTAGKLRFRNEEEKSFKDGNSAYAEKGDIVTVTGSVYAANENRDDHAACRVFQK